MKFAEFHIINAQSNTRPFARRRDHPHHHRLAMNAFGHEAVVRGQFDIHRNQLPQPRRRPAAGQTSRTPVRLMFSVTMLLRKQRPWTETWQCSRISILGLWRWLIYFMSGPEYIPNLGAGTARVQYRKWVT